LIVLVLSSNQTWSDKFSQTYDNQELNPIRALFISVGKTKK